MKFEVDTDTILQVVTDKMLSNLEANVRGNKELSEEEVQATIVLNKKKILKDAQSFAAFFVSLYVEAPAESVEETPAE